MYTRIIKTCVLLLVIIGAGGYLLSGRASPTALIPVAIGALLWLAEAFGSRRKQVIAKLWAPLIALIGLAGTIGGIPGLIASLSGDGGGSSLPNVARSLTAIVCIVVLVAVFLRWRGTAEPDKSTE